MRKILLWLFVFACSAINAQVIEWHRNDINVTSKEYMINFDSVVYIPEQDWSVEIELDSLYVIDSETHVVAQITVGANAHLAKAACGIGLSPELIAKNESDVKILQAGTTQSVDFRIPTNSIEDCYIMVVTQNKYNSFENYPNYYVKTRSASPWKSLGMGKFADAFLGGPYYFEVEILQNELEPNYFRVMRPYAGLLSSVVTDPYLEFFILPAGSEFAGQTTDAEYVIFKDYSTGQWNSNYAEDIYALHPYRFGRTPDKWTYNVVLDYQENGLPGEVSLAPIYYLFNEGSGWDKTTANTISILFPGYERPDYSATLEFDSVVAKPDSGIYATGNLTLGNNATNVKAIVMPAEVDAAAVADAIAAGELEGVDVKAGRIEVPFDAEELGGNNFKIIVTVLVNGAVKNIATASFEYYEEGKNPWQSIGTGFFTDDIVAPLFSSEAATYEVEILENTENPGLYRIMNPYSNSVYPYAQNDCAPEGLYLEVNAIDAEGIYIQQQSLGFDWGYGEFSFVSEGARYLASHDFETVKGAGYLGKVVEGVIKFPVFTASGSTNYQGILYMGTSGHHAGMNGKIEITLPSANAYAKNMAKAKANVTKRSSIKKSFSGVKAEMRKKVLTPMATALETAPNHTADFDSTRSHKIPVAHTKQTKLQQPQTGEAIKVGRMDEKAIW